MGTTGPAPVKAHPNVILLAGAGSSCHLGLPSLDHVLDGASIGDDEIADRIKRARNEIQNPRFRPAVFEELIVRLRHYLWVAQTLRRDHAFRYEAGALPLCVDNGSLEQKWKSALSHCYRVLIREYGPERTRYESAPFQVIVELVKTLAEINGGLLHLYTTNYDCSLQVLASYCRELALFTHIDNKTGLFSEGWSVANPHFFAPEPTGVPRVYVHRLHGCIAWFNVSDDDEPGKGTLVKEIPGIADHLEIKDDDFLSKMCIKLVQSQLVGTNPVFFTSFDEFSTDLRKADVLLVWGFSFRDLEVVRVINQAFSERSSPLPVLCLDPYLSAQTARLNIELTLFHVPIHAAPEFVPQKVSWSFSDGDNMITERVRQAVKDVISRGKE